MARLFDILREAIDKGASDIHISKGLPPQVRIDGHLHPLGDHPPLSAEDCARLCTETLSDAMRETLESERELDLSFPIEGLCRFRGNVFWQQESMAAAFRQIPFEIPSFEQLGLPAAIMGLTEKTTGIVLVTGPTGSGKSTTLSAMIERINQTRSDHIITIEDPVEFIYTQQKCTIAQREVGNDTKTFSAALKYALRQDPDVILVGEMRDLETIHNAISAAETGHLVFGTLHTNSAVQTVDRIIDVFPPHQQSQVRTQLSFILEGVISQQLIPKIGGGRIAAQEIMIPNHAIRNLIRENKTHQLYSTMQMDQGKSGMVTLNQCLAKFVSEDKIERDEALRRSADKDELLDMLDRSTSDPLSVLTQSGGSQATESSSARDSSKPAESFADRMKNLGRKPKD